MRGLSGLRPYVIMNASGAVMSRGQASDQFPIQVGHLCAGVYGVKLVDEDGAAEVIRFIKH